MVEYLKIDDIKYKFNLKNLVNFITETDVKNSPRTTVKSEQHGYPINETTGSVDMDNIQLISREVTETTSNFNDANVEIKYKMIKYFLDVILNEDSKNIKESNNVMFKLTFNTLISEKIIEVIK